MINTEITEIYDVHCIDIHLGAESSCNVRWLEIRPHKSTGLPEMSQKDKLVLKT
jgi:hypothetical protein